MAENYCAAFPQCDLPAGRVTFVVNVVGPRVGSLSQSLRLGGLSYPTTGICPYLRITYEQVWVPQEVCNGPIRSVMGLAPGESVVTEMRQVDQWSYTTLVRNAFESSETTSLTKPADQVD